jgi:hypothetical protein
MVRRSSLLILCSLFLSISPSFAAGPVAAEPIYMKTSDGWKGFYGVEDEYAEYTLKGSDVKIHDAYHALLNPSLGLSVTFASRDQIGAGDDLLSDQLRWELDYWRQHADKVEPFPRNDLSGGRDDVRVTELRMYNAQRGQLIVYMIAMAAKKGVFVLSVSPVNASHDALVKEMAASFKLVHRTLDGDEVKRRTLEERAKH